MTRAAEPPMRPNPVTTLARLLLLALLVLLVAQAPRASAQEVQIGAAQAVGLHPSPAAAFILSTRAKR